MAKNIVKEVTKGKIVNALKLPKIPKAPATKSASAPVMAKPLLQKGKRTAKSPAKAPEPKMINRFPTGRKSAKHPME